MDLLKFLDDNNYNFSDKSVLDLGCGHGLLGIYTKLKGAKKVIFQDFNKEVLEYATKKNLEGNGI